MPGPRYIGATPLPNREQRVRGARREPRRGGRAGAAPSERGEPDRAMASPRSEPGRAKRVGRGRRPHRAEQHTRGAHRGERRDRATSHRKGGSGRGWPCRAPHRAAAGTPRGEWEAKRVGQRTAAPGGGGGRVRAQGPRHAGPHQARAGTPRRGRKKGGGHAPWQRQAGAETEEEEGGEEEEGDGEAGNSPRG
jgi:hypothetical protein|eukprot:XP_020393786.1 uncharacterized protein LOC109939837 [Zea mays]